MQSDRGLQSTLYAKAYLSINFRQKTFLNLILILRFWLMVVVLQSQLSGDNVHFLFVIHNNAMAFVTMHIFSLTSYFLK